MSWEFFQYIEIYVFAGNIAHIDVSMEEKQGISSWVCNSSVVGIHIQRQKMFVRWKSTIVVVKRGLRGQTFTFGMVVYVVYMVKNGIKCTLFG